MKIRDERSYPADPGFWDSEEDHLWVRRALWDGYPWSVELRGLRARRARGDLIILLLCFIVTLRSTRRCVGHQLHTEHGERVSWAVVNNGGARRTGPLVAAFWGRVLLPHKQDSRPYRR